MENGRRLENLSWRLWNRETFCCAPDSQPTSRTIPSSCRHPSLATTVAARPTKHTTSAHRASSHPDTLAIPALSSSLESVSSDDAVEASSPITPRIPKARPELRRNESTDSSRSRGREKHITPIDLEKIVISIKEAKPLEPIDLPTMSVATPPSYPMDPPSTSASQVLSQVDLTSSGSLARSQDSTPHPSESQATLLESSASTVATTGSDASNSSHIVGSQESSSTEMSTHSIVRGFVPGGAPSSYRSQTNLAALPQPILKTSPTYRPVPPKKKGAMFTIGTSSGEDESSLESHMYKSQLSESLKRGSTLSHAKKHTSFKDEIAVGKAAARHSPVFESDDEDDEISESAIEEDDDSSDWEDSDEGSGPSSVNERDLFQRVDSRPNLTSRRSLLTSLMHEPERARALQNAASRSSPAIRRSRTTTPIGPSVPASPESNVSLHQMAGQEIQRSKPIIMTTSNTHQQLALSPRTTRRNMLSTELTESLRKNLLWERQHRSTGNLAALKRRHTSTDVKNLKQHPEPGPVLRGGAKPFSNDYFDAGLQEYHAKGW